MIDKAFIRQDPFEVWGDDTQMRNWTHVGNRVADNSLAKKLLNWQPKMQFADSLRRMLEWYFANKDRDEVCRTLARRLTKH